jgi:hypothetical protein
MRHKPQATSTVLKGPLSESVMSLPRPLDVMAWNKSSHLIWVLWKRTALLPAAQPLASLLLNGPGSRLRTARYIFWSIVENRKM